MYNRKVYESYLDWDSQKNMQYTVELHARQSRLNSESYVFYAGGKLFSHCTVLTVLGAFES